MDSQYFMKVQGTFFRLFGFELTETSLVFKRPAVNFLTTGPFIVIIWPLFMSACNNIKDVDKLTQSLVPVISAVCVICKFVIFLYIHKALGQIIVGLKKMLDRESQSSPFYANIINTENELEQRNSKKMGIFVVLTALSLNLIAPLKMLIQLLLTGHAEVELQLPAEVPLDIHYLPNYLLFYTLSFAAIIAATCTNVSLDLLYLGIILNFITLFRIAQHKVTHLDWKSVTSSPSELYELFRMHQNILKICQEFDTSFEPLICVQYFMASLVICVTGFQVTAKLLDPQVLFLSLYMVTTLIELFIFSYYGEVLKTESENFSVAVYNSPWYEGSRSVARSLHIALIRGQRPCIINGYFFEANLFTFSSIVRTAMSYMTLLRSFS